MIRQLIGKLNILYLYYIMVGLCVGLQAGIFLCNQYCYSVGLRGYLFNISTEIAIALILALAFNKRWRWGALVFPIISVVILLVNGVYTYYFCDYLSLDLLKSWRNLQTMDSNYIFTALHWWMCGLVLPICLLLLFYFCNRQRIEGAVITVRNRLKLLAVGCIMFIFGQGFVVLTDLLFHDDISFGSVYNDYVSVGSSLHECVDKWGITPMYVTSMMPWFALAHLSDEDMDAIHSFITESKGTLPQNYAEIFAKNRGKRLILIIVESLSSTTINKVVQNQRLMPFLDSIVKSEDAIVFDNICSQVKNGMSSDGQLMYNTGFYPLSIGIASFASLPISYALADHISRPGTKVELIAEDAEFWNHRVTNKAWGYDSLDHSIAIKNGQLRPFAEADSLVFKRAKEILKQQDVAMMTICTYGMHGPYSAGDLESFHPEEIGQSVDVCGFWEMTRRFDHELEGFISFLQQSNLYDDSVVVIVSDHTPHMYRHTTLSKAIPFIVLNSGVHFESSVLAGQIDVYPTMLDVMGKLDNSPWPGFGHSLFRKQSGVVGYTSYNGQWFGSHYPIDSDEKKRIMLGHKLSEKILCRGFSYFIKQ